MAYTFEDFERDYTLGHLNRLPVDEILKKLPEDEVLKHYSIDKMLRRFSAEDIEAYLKKISRTDEK